MYRILRDSLHFFPCCHSLLGWLHVHSWRRSEHPWEQKDWLALQDLAFCSQLAGVMLGETHQGLSPPGFSPHHAAAEPGPHTGAHWTLEIGTVEHKTELGVGLRRTARTGTQHRRKPREDGKTTLTWSSSALKPKTEGCLFFFSVMMKILAKRGLFYEFYSCATIVSKSIWISS